MAGWAMARLGREARALLGIAGPPGAGKSTVATALTAHLRGLGVATVLVPMDGFHLAQVELQRTGRAGRKGAPDTFDALGYLALLSRCRHEREETVYAPVFRRDLEEPVAGAIAVEPSARLVLTEGNYLLDLEPPWDRVAPLLDEVWYLEVDEADRVERLVARHMRYGRSEAQARQWVAQVDQVNAARVEQGRGRAGRVVRPAPSWPAAGR